MNALVVTLHFRVMVLYLYFQIEHIYTRIEFTPPFGKKINDDLLFPPSGKIALSSEGTVLAVSKYTSSTGSIQTYRFEGDKWVALGKRITDTVSGTIITSIGISGDGSILAYGTSKGSAGAFAFISSLNTWYHFAVWSFGDNFGVSLALSDNGEVLAVGQHGNVKTFELRSKFLSAGVMGPDIPFFANGGKSNEAPSLSLSSDGRVLILGNFDEDYNYQINGKDNVGVTLVYHFDDDDLKWRQFGDDLKQTSSSEDFGHAVAISADGTELAIAASCDGGCTFVYRLE